LTLCGLSRERRTGNELPLADVGRAADRQFDKQASPAPGGALDIDRAFQMSGSLADADEAETPAI
jgi:hypothetical protein